MRKPKTQLQGHRRAAPHPVQRRERREGELCVFESVFVQLYLYTCEDQIYLQRHINQAVSDFRIKSEVYDRAMLWVGRGEMQEMQGQMWAH